MDSNSMPLAGSDPGPRLSTRSRTTNGASGIATGREGSAAFPAARIPWGARRIAGGIVWRLAVFRRQVAHWWNHDHVWLGRLVEWSGNRVCLDGCRFDVSHRQISSALRDRLLRGRYERAERAILRDWLDPAAPVIELGGGIGVIATLINRRLHDPTRHFVVEANPALIPVIHTQRTLNGASFVVVHAALDYSGGPTARLHVSDEFISARVAEKTQSGIEVPSVTLEKLFTSHTCTDATVICDIEGMETQLVELEGEVLRRCCRLLVLEVHPEFRSGAEIEALFARLDRLGFRRLARVRKVHAFSRD